MFPHYAQATTESALKHAYKQLKSMQWHPEIIEMGHFDTDEEYVIPLTNSIQSQIDKDTHRLFSYHGCNHSTSRELTRVRITAKKNRRLLFNWVRSKLTVLRTSLYEYDANGRDLLGLSKINGSLSFQSRLGPVKWLEPSTMDKVEELVKRGVKS